MTSFLPFCDLTFFSVVSPFFHVNVCGRRSFCCPSPEHRSLNSLLQPVVRLKADSQVEMTPPPPGESCPQGRLSPSSTPGSVALTTSAGDWNLRSARPHPNSEEGRRKSLQPLCFVDSLQGSLSSSSTPQREDIFSVSSSLFAVSPLIPHMEEIAPHVTEELDSDNVFSSETTEQNLSVRGSHLDQDLEPKSSYGYHILAHSPLDERHAVKKELSSSSMDSISMKVVAGVEQRPPPRTRLSVAGRRPVACASDEPPCRVTPSAFRSPAKSPSRQGLGRYQTTVYKHVRRHSLPPTPPLVGGHDMHKTLSLSSLKIVDGVPADRSPRLNVAATPQVPSSSPVRELCHMFCSIVQLRACKLERPCQNADTETHW